MLMIERAQPLPRNEKPQRANPPGFYEANSAVRLVPNFTEERVKRFARILELNESLIDDLWQLAV